MIISFATGISIRASVFGSDVYVVSAPEYCERILRRNWRNYARKGQVVKRIALLLGNGLISSNGEFWASQRRMIQPAFSKNSIGSLTNIITSVNAELLEKWKRAAKRRETVNVTHDVSFMVLKLMLIATFGDDYAAVAPAFQYPRRRKRRATLNLPRLFVPWKNHPQDRCTKAARQHNVDGFPRLG